MKLKSKGEGAVSGGGVQEQKTQEALSTFLLRSEGIQTLCYCAEFGQQSGRNSSSLRNPWQDNDHGDTAEEHAWLEKGLLIYRGQARMRKRGITTWLHTVQVWRDHEMTEFGILRKLGKQLAKVCTLNLWVGFDAVKELLDRTSWGTAVKVMPRRCGTQWGGSEPGMEAQDWIGLAKSAEKTDGYCHKVAFTCEKALPWGQALANVMLI